MGNIQPGMIHHQMSNMTKQMKPLNIKRYTAKY